MQQAAYEVSVRVSSAVITGSSGFIGTHLARRLVQAGVSVTCLDLVPPREQLSGVTYITADVRNLRESDFPVADVCWNLAAIHTTPGHPDHEYYDTNINGALEVARLASMKGIKRIIFTSSISVYGPSEAVKDEASEPSPISAYGRSKLIAEKVLRNWQAEEPSRRVTIIRPAVVFGRGERGNFTRMAGLLRSGIFIFPGSRDVIKSCIYVDDLLDLAMRADSECTGVVLCNGAYVERTSIQDIVRTLKELYFPRAILLDLPSRVVLVAAKTIGAFRGVGGIHPERVQKLLRSTNIFPKWASDRKLLGESSFADAIKRWAVDTDRTFS